MSTCCCLLLLAALAGPPQSPDGDASGDPDGAPRRAGAAAPAAAESTVAAENPVPGGGPWRLVNQVEVIANEDIVTRRRLEAQARRVLARHPISTPEEMAALYDEIALREVQSLLMTQRGRDFGFDPDAVQRTVSLHMEGQVEDAGGVGELAERLSLRGETAVQRKQAVTDELYALSYDRAIVGLASGPKGRPIRDRYVRPGILALFHGSLEHQPAGIRAVGGRPESYVLQQLVLDASAFPSPEHAREHAAELREEALSGADFERLVLEFSFTPAERGLTRPMTPAELRRVSPEIARFCAENEVGAISEVFPVLENGRPIGFRVMRIHEHETLELPPFGVAGVQVNLRELVLQRRDGMLREQALRELFRSSYIWTPEHLRPPDSRQPSDLAPDGEAAPAGGGEPADPPAPDGRAG